MCLLYMYDAGLFTSVLKNQILSFKHDIYFPLPWYSKIYSSRALFGLNLASFCIYIIVLT